MKLSRTLSVALAVGLTLAALAPAVADAATGFLARNNYGIAQGSIVPAGTTRIGEHGSVVRRYRVAGTLLDTARHPSSSSAYVKYFDLSRRTFVNRRIGTAGDGHKVSLDRTPLVARLSDLKITVCTRRYGVERLRWTCGKPVGLD